MKYVLSNSLSLLACLHAAPYQTDEDEGNGKTTHKLLTVFHIKKLYFRASVVCIFCLNAFIIPCRPSVISIFIVPASPPPPLFIFVSLVFCVSLVTILPALCLTFFCSMGGKSQGSTLLSL